MLFDLTADIIIEVVRSNFPHGVRADYIDANKILRICVAQHPNENISRELILQIIRAHGIEYGGRFYFVSDDNTKAILMLVDKILQKYPLAYYSTIYDRNTEFFTQMNIFNANILRKILQENDSRHAYFDDFCAVSLMVRLDYEIARIFATTNNPISVEDLHTALFYVPHDKITAILSDTNEYLQTTNGDYLPTTKLQFDQDEITAAVKQIRHAITVNSYATQDDYDLSANLALNHYIAERDLRNLIYEKFFAKEFTKRGNKLFAKDNVAAKPATIREILREFISLHDELSTATLFNYAKTHGVLSKGNHVALNAAFEQMIRVDKNLFVKDTLINFDIDAVDNALSLFVQDKIIPLRAVVSFTGFPNLRGYTWNLFMLETFLRKFSRQYSFICAASNSSNIGAIFPKPMNLTKYLDVQAKAVLQENIPLDIVAVENFLNQSGYRANFRDSKLTQRVISRVQGLRGNF